MSIYEYDEEKQRKFDREEGREEGRKEGKAEGIDMIVNLLKMLSPDSKEYAMALNGTAADRMKLFEKYNIK